MRDAKVSLKEYLYYSGDICTTKKKQLISFSYMDQNRTNLHFVPICGTLGAFNKQTVHIFPPTIVSPIIRMRYNKNFLV